MKTLRYILAISCLSIVFTAYGQEFGSQPAAQFRSTSVMAGSGSAYSSNPMLNADGTASYNAPSYSPAQAPAGPMRAPGKTGSDKDNPTVEGPVGDAVLPLMLCVLIYAGWQIRKRWKKTSATT